MVLQAVPLDEDFLHPNSLEDLLSTAAETTDVNPYDPAFDSSETHMGLQEHRYSLPAPDPDARAVPTVMEEKRRKTVIEPSFAVYNQIAR